MSRSRRMVSGLDAGFAALLALVLLVILNFLAHRWNRTWDWSARGEHTLSDKTLTLLKEGVAKQKDPVRIATFFHPGNGFEGELQTRVRGLLDRYKEACPSLRIEHVDPYVDDQRAKALVRELLDTGKVEMNSVVLACGKRRKTVSESSLAVAGDPDAEGAPQKIQSFKAEDALSSALGSVLTAKQARIAYLTGHGEQSISDEKNPRSLFLFKDHLDNQSLKLEETTLSSPQPLEGRFDLVVVAGPTASYTAAEQDILDSYLRHGGRLLVMMDAEPGPGNKGLLQNGLEPLLARWGVAARDELLIDPAHAVQLDRNAPPRGEFFFTDGFKPHPITRGMDSRTPVVLIGARPVEPAPGDAPSGIRISPLFEASASAWAKHDLRDLAIKPLAPDKRLDRRGPHCLGVAVELDAADGAAGTGAKAGRAVILGDADMAAALSLSISPSNKDFLSNAIYWLLDRQESMGISPRADAANLTMAETDFRKAWLPVMGLAPAILAAIGLAVWISRRF